MTKTPTVVGLDLSLTSSGVARWTERQGWRVERVTSKGSASASVRERHVRITELTADILEAGGVWQADLVVVEGPAYSKVQGHQHDRSYLWWSVVGSLFTGGIPVAEVPPTVLKKYATGVGNAAKDEVLAAAVRRYPTAKISNNDEADAVVLAAMGARYLKHPLDKLPTAQASAIERVRWVG